MKKHVTLLLLAGLAAGCGLREPLQPPESSTKAPAPVAMNRALTTDELLTPPPITRPERVDELLRRSEPRADDQFDLPPPDVPPGTIPVPPDESVSEGPQ